MCDAAAGGPPPLPVGWTAGGPAVVLSHRPARALLRGLVAPKRHVACPSACPRSVRATARTARDGAMQQRAVPLGVGHRVGAWATTILSTGMELGTFCAIRIAACHRETPRAGSSWTSP